jgi:segregation and condensation protein B
MENLKYAIEGILFAAGESVKTAKLAVVLDKTVDEVTEAVEELKAEYDRDKRGFTIIEISDGYQISSRPDYYKYIREILGEQRNQPLSNAAMEALAIIAYKQPVTRGMIEKVRGVNSDGCVSRLYERGLIEEAGRLDAPGRPVLYKTTDTFLRCFGLRTPRDLPPIDFKNTMPELADTGEQLVIADDVIEETPEEN